MTQESLWRSVNYGPDGRAHVTVTDPRSGPVTVIMLGSEVQTTTGEEIIRRALAARRAAYGVVHGEGS